MNTSKKVFSLVFFTLLLNLAGNVNIQIADNDSNSNLKLTKIELGSPAEAGEIQDIGKILKDNWSGIRDVLWSPNNKQVYMLHLTSQEVNSIRNQYRGRAEGVLRNNAIEKMFNMMGFNWFQRTAGWGAQWAFLVAKKMGFIISTCVCQIGWQMTSRKYEVTS